VQVIGAKKRRKAENRRNELKHYQSILGSFKRIRILSAVETIVQNPPLVDPDDPDDPFRAEEVSVSSIPPWDHPLKDWDYYFPLGREEKDGNSLEELKHWMLEELCGSLIIAPVRDRLQDLSWVMDLGSGSGDWGKDGTSP